MRTSKKAGRGGSWGVRAGDGQAAAPALSPAMTRYRASSPSQRSVVGVLLRSIIWFVVLLVVLVAGFLLWRHFNPHEKISSVATSVAAHGTAAALGVFVAALLGSALFAGTRMTAQALAL